MAVPEADEGDGEGLGCLHKSFSDFLFDSNRWGFSHNVRGEGEKLKARACLNIIEQVPHDSDDLARGKGIDCDSFGILRGCICDNISLSWPGDERFRRIDAYIRHDLYWNSMDEVCFRFRPDHPP